MDIKGMQFFAEVAGDFTLAKYTSSLTKLKAMGFNWVTIVDHFYQADATATTFVKNTARGSIPSLTDSELLTAITEAKNRGFKIMYKPHLQCEDGIWRGSLSPSNTDTWFANFTTMINQYADYAQLHQLDMFCVGSEFVSLNPQAGTYTQKWKDVIASVRTHYTGLITFGGQANAIDQDEYSKIGFWSDVDYIGIHTYHPLTGKDNPTRAELVKGWSFNKDTRDALTSYRNLNTTYGKPVFIAEVGYHSQDGVNQKPWTSADAALHVSDPQEQADCYQALLQVLGREGSWCKGVVWWHWKLQPDTQIKGYTPEGKTAENVLNQWFGRVNSMDVNSKGILDGFSESGTFYQVSDVVGTDYSDATVSMATCAVSQLLGVDMQLGGTVDSTVFNRTITVTGTTYTAGQNGRTFNGTSDFLDCGNMPIGGTDKSFTVRLWVKRAVTGVDNFIVAQGTATPGNELHIGYQINNIFRFSFFGVQIDSTTAFTTPNVWHCWDLTYDGVSGKASMYLNNELIRFGTPGSDFTGTGNFFIGKRATGAFRGFNGVIGLVEVYNRVLTDAERTSKYNAETTKYV